MPALDSYAIATEVVGPAPMARSAYTYPIEVVGPTPFARSAFFHAVEVVGPSAALNRSAYVSAVEVVVTPPAAPPKLMVWNPQTGQYERDPWFIWNGTAWVQAL